jgi:hypothetical protein
MVPLTNDLMMVSKLATIIQKLTNVVQPPLFQPVPSCCLQSLLASGDQPPNRAVISSFRMLLSEGRLYMYLENFSNNDNGVSRPLLAA